MGRAKRNLPGKVKTDTHPASRAAKLDLRRRVLLELVGEARVLDVFCGRGEMYQGAWRDAASYIGCDERAWERTDPPRFVADNRRVLRCVDLQAFNVFDLDAYGSPWEQMTILAARRTWAPGERGAVVLTDGSSLKLRWGGRPRAMAAMAGLDGTQGVPTTAGVPELIGLALAGWVKRSRVKVLRMWQAEGKPPACVLYTAVVFVGRGEAA